MSYIYLILALIHYLEMLKLHGYSLLAIVGIIAYIVIACCNDPFASMLVFFYDQYLATALAGFINSIDSMFVVIIEKLSLSIIANT